MAEIPAAGSVEPIALDVKVVKEIQNKNTAESKVLEIPLDDQELHLFESLKGAAEALKKGELKGLDGPRDVQIRVAGGWVRDKILGLATHDVDVALDTCTGVEFANVVKEYVTVFQHEHCGKIGVIAANPDQSKHLETATMKLHGIEVDFSNLRHETYAEDSRIPTTVVGTPLEDAYRRDFTMNTLFYNLKTGKVEDWTRRGLKDLLETKLVVTPLESFKTFHDDPLRVLRAIRFAVRYEMRLSEELKSASMEPQIQHELRRKVSRERVGKELEGMLSGKHADPRQAFTLFCELSLEESIFSFPSSNLDFCGSIALRNLELKTFAEDRDGRHEHRAQAWVESKECLSVVADLVAALNVPSEARTKLDKRLLFLVTSLLPFMRLQYNDRNKNKYVVEYMMREGIKFKNKDVQNIIRVADNLDAMIQLLQQAPDSSPETRLQAGLLLRNTKDLWVTLLYVSTISEVRMKTSGIDWPERANKWLATIVNELALDECWNLKPLMNGKELMTEIGLPKGPEIGRFSAEQVRWTLMNPKGTKKEAIDFLLGMKEKLLKDADKSEVHVSKKAHL